MPGEQIKRGLILIAEDNDDQREVLKRLLINEGFDVLEAADGGEAIGLCERETPDLIVMDLQMPGVDGVATIKRLRNSERLRRVPVIATSAFGNLGIDLFNVFEDPAEAPEYFAKPAYESIIRRIKELLRRPESL